MFQRAVERGNLLVAELTAREIGLVSLEDALQLTALVAEKAPGRFERFASRWLRRYVEATPEVKASEIAFVASALEALRSDRTRRAAFIALSSLVAPFSRRSLAAPSQFADRHR